MSRDEILGWVVALGAAMFVASLVALPIVLIRLPANYLNRRRSPFARWRQFHPVAAWSIVGLKNLLGILLIVAGLVMFFTPGQGLLTLIVGLALTDLPGKHELERRLIGRPHVLKAINAVRRRAARPPLDEPRRRGARGNP